MTEETETVSYEPPVEDDDCDDQENTLTMNDRCDNCGAQAYVQAFFGQSSLLFCAHHYNEYEEKISKIATTIFDKRSDLLEQSRR